MQVMQIFIAVVIISAIVGAVAQFLSKMNEQQANAGKRAAARPSRAEGGAVRQSAGDVDRFLAEIDRLRRRNADGTARGRKRSRPRGRPAASSRSAAAPWPSRCSRPAAPSAPSRRSWPRWS